MGGKKREPKVVYTPAPVAPAVAIQRQGSKSFDQDENVSDIETGSDLYIKKKRKGKRALVAPKGGASIPSDTSSSGLSVPY
jgi:hypothetical protein